MLSARQLTSKVLRSKFAGLLVSSKSGYHWGNYDVTPGQCCKVRPKETTKCLAKYSICKPTEIPNTCAAKEDDEYSKQLLQILQPKEGKCELFKHDVCYYQPSDKRRRYQRTWPECSMPIFQPKKVCCYDTEHLAPLRRRPRPPQRPQLTIIEKHAFQMALLCKEFKDATNKKKKCVVSQRPKNCERTQTPFPSFSECNKKCMQGYCPTECGCKTHPSMCEVWRQHHRNGGYVKKCTEAIVGYCPFNRRVRFLN